MHRNLQSKKFIFIGQIYGYKGEMNRLGVEYKFEFSVAWRSKAKWECSLHE